MIPIRPLAVIFFMILSATTFAHDASTDTTLVLGGPDRWDGSFEDATGSPAWHGWTHADLYHPNPQSFWEASDHLPLMGGYSAWCGTWFNNSCQDGYGNDWFDSLELSGTAANPAVATTVHWQAVVKVDSEPGYDYLHLQVGRGNSWEDVQAPIDGSGTWNIDLTFTIDPADYVDGTWRLRFLADSDNGWSDEDCNLDTQGLARVDNVIVTSDGMVVNDQDFEDGTLGDWLPHAASEVGDFTSLRRDLIDVDPDPASGNDSWQVTFIDDGEVVPGTGGTPCVNWCYGPFGWVFNVTAGLDGHGVSGQPFGLGNGGVWNGITSPALAWPEGADAGEIAFDVYAHMQTFECGATAYGWSFRATSATDPSALESVDWQTTRWSTFNQESMPPGPGYYRIIANPDELPVDARWAQVRIEAYEVGPFCWGEYVTEGTPAPYFDNVAVRAWRSVSDVPTKDETLSLTAAPNPFNPRVTIRWSQPVAGPVELSIYDMRGHRVRQLVTGDRPAGSGEMIWDGRDDAGGGMPSGIYLVRLKTSAGNELRKLTLMR
ncbi:MAG: T9SS type A sorting domain-containing protein [Candidatus Krumholzibacteria bacterium]|nr:T9SS type A sorting domain-containing protein [Candidatus Krumholzibacteria bacterium]